MIVRRRPLALLVFVVLLAWASIPPASAQGPARPPALGGGGGGGGGLSTGTGSSGETEAIPGNAPSDDETYREIEGPGSLYGTDKQIASTVNERPDQQPGVTMPNTFEDPESGYAGVMLENSMRKMSSNLLNSPLSLFYLVMGLTDPGVSDNFAKATQHSLLMVNNTYAHKMYEMAKEERMGGTGVQRAMERMVCLRQERQEMTDRGEPDNWYKADAVCRRALDISNPTAATVGAAPQDADFTGQAPGPERLRAEAPVSCDQLVDKHSFVEQHLLPGEQFLELSNGTTYRFVPQEQFKLRFGDIYTGKAPGGTEGNSQEVFCVVPPKRDARRQHYELRNQLWKAFLKVLEERCKSAASQEASIAQQYVPFDPAQRTTFWRVGSAQLGRTFDFADYQFKPATVDIIYEMFIAKELRDITPDACTRRLGPDQPENKIENLIRGNVSVAGRAIRVRDEHRFVFTLLEYVTRGQMLDVAWNWSDYLKSDKNFSTPPPPQMRTKIAERVAAFVNLQQSEVIPELRDQNVKAFRRFIEQVHQLGAEQSGHGGKGLVDAFAAARSGKDGTMGSGLAGQGQ